MRTLESIIEPEIISLRMFREYATEFGESILNACKVMNLQPEQIKHCEFYSSGGGFLHIWIRLNDGRTVGFHSETKDITIHSKEWDIEETEDWLYDFTEKLADNNGEGWNVARFTSLKKPAKKFINK